MRLYTSNMVDLTGASRKALRLYEEHNLLTKVGRDINGWRIYNAEHLLRVATIKLLQESGMTLSDIFTILHDTEVTHPWDLAEERLTARLKDAQAKLSILQQLKASHATAPNLPLYSPAVRALLDAMISRHYPADMAFRSGRILQFLEITLDAGSWQKIQHMACEQINNIDDELIHLAQEFVALTDEPEDSPRITMWRDRMAAYADNHPGVVLTDFTHLNIGSGTDDVLSQLWTDGLSHAQLRASALLDSALQR